MQIWSDSAKLIKMTGNPLLKHRRSMECKIRCTILAGVYTGGQGKLPPTR